MLRCLLPTSSAIQEAFVPGRKARDSAAATKAPQKEVFGWQMVEYVGMSVQDVYKTKCAELGCKANSLLVKELCKVPDVFDTATTLDLSNNFVGPKGLLPVLEVVKVSSGLRYLSLRDNQLTNKCVMNLADVVQTHKGITALDLSNNPITIGAGKAILEMVKVNTQLEEVYLENTCVKEMLLRAIDVQLKKNQTDSKRPAAATSADAPLEDTLTSEISPGMVRKYLSALPSTVHEMLFDENPVQHLTKLCSDSQATFTDPLFPPDWKSVQKSGLKEYPVSGWMRVKDMPNSRLFPDSVDLSQVVTGASGTSWLMESLAALVREGERVESLITPKQTSVASVYTVKLFIDGKPRYIVVDDWIPVDVDGNPVFSRVRTESGGAWIMLIEKAVAKAHGSYQAIDASVSSTHPLEKAPNSATGMVDFTGGVGISRDLHQDDFNAEEWWGELLDLSAKGALMTATTAGRGSSGALGEIGLEENFCYGILAVRALNGHRLLQLNSCYTPLQWEGEWCDGSPLWDQYPDVKDALELQVRREGSFWMPYVSFLRYCDAVHIVKTFSSRQAALVAGEWDHASAGGPYFEQTWSQNARYKLTVQKQGRVFINLSIPDKRFARSDIDTMAFHVLKADYFPVGYDKDNVVIKTPYLVTNSVSFEGELDHGTYWLVPSTYIAGKTGSFNVRILSEAPFTVQRERLEKYWREESVRSKWAHAGEYQSGEDHPQFELCIAPSPEPARVLISVDGSPHDDHCLVVFVCAGTAKGKRMLGSLEDSCIMAKSKYLIGSSVQLECQLPGGDTPYVIVPCLQPEGSCSMCKLQVLCSVPTFSLTELRMWSKKEASALWSKSSTYQDATGNPQFELVCPIEKQEFVVKLEVTGHDDPSILFFVVDNNGRQSKGLSGLIPESQILCTRSVCASHPPGHCGSCFSRLLVVCSSTQPPHSTYIRGSSISKDFVLPSPPSDSYIIVPMLQPPGMLLLQRCHPPPPARHRLCCAGSAANCKITVSCPSDDYQLHNVFEY